jgi:ADP-ribose pyrophosphatase
MMQDPMTEKTLATRRIFEGRALTIDILDIELPTGRTSTREVLRHRGAVCILAQRPDGQFVLVRQYRKAVERTLLECVAGCMEEGEAPEMSALRETREESGYEVAQLVSLGHSLPAPGYCDEVHYHFYARLKPLAGELQLDTDENLYPVFLSAEELDAAIEDGTIDDGKTMILWDLYKRALKRGVIEG